MTGKGAKHGETRASREASDPARIRFIKPASRPAEEAGDIAVARLVVRFQSGEAETFAEVYQRYFDRVYTYLRLVLRGSHEAEDAAQQVFMEALEGLPRYELRGAPFRAWLFVIARHHTIRHMKRASRSEPVDPAELDRHRESNGSNGAAALDALRWITDQDLLVFIERLPLPQRQAIVLQYLFDLSSTEVAEVMDRTPEAVRMLQHRALTFLRRRLTAIGREPRRVERGGSRTLGSPARVVRARRFSLTSSGPTG